MTTKSNLKGLTITEIKSQYPLGNYKSSMKKADVIDEAVKVSSYAKTKSVAASQNAER